MKKNKKDRFEQYQGSDADYLIIAEPLDLADSSCYGFIPNEGLWETLEEAIEYLSSKKNYRLIEIYDLYAPFETAIIKCIGLDYKRNNLLS